MDNVYSTLKLFHFPEKLRAVARGDITAPMHVRIKPINACNHHCSFCCYQVEGLQLGELMRKKDMIPQEKMLEIVRDLGDVGVQAVTFTGGGEPLLYPHLVEAVEGLLERQIKVAVLTNGSRLCGDIGHILARGASWVRVSLDAADGPTLQASRDVGAAEFDTILANIRAFAAAKNDDCELGINYIITRENAEHTFEFMRLMKESGAGHVKVSECVTGNGSAKNQTYHAPHFESVKEQLQRAEQELTEGSFAVIDKFHISDGQYEKGYSTCPFIQYLNVIGADQVVYACQDKAYTRSGRLGSIAKHSLRELWSSAEYRDRLLSLDPAAACNHHCVQHEKNLALHSYMRTDERHLAFV